MVDKASQNVRQATKVGSFQRVFLILGCIWWGYITFLLASLGQTSNVLLLMSLVLLLVLIAVCWRLSGFLWPVGNDKVAWRNSVGMVVLMLITGFVCNRFVHREEQAREKRFVEPEIRQLAETVTYHLLDQSYINYKDYQKALLSELDPLTCKILQDKKMLAQSNEAIEDKDQLLQKSKQITSVDIKSISVKDAIPIGYFPVDVTGRVASQSTNANENIEESFCMHYLIGKFSHSKSFIVASVAREVPSTGIERTDVCGGGDFDSFARCVARHLLDKSYISYEENSIALVSGELSDSVVAQLQKEELLPKNMAEMHARWTQLKKDGILSAIRFDESTVGEPNEHGLVPVELKGQVVSKSSKLQPFKLWLLIGINSKTNNHVVAEIRH